MLAKLRRLFAKLSMALVLFLAAVHFTPLVSWAVLGILPAEQAADGDTLIVLGADAIGSDELLGPTSYWRCVYAVWAYRKGHFSRVVVSGGDVGGGSGLADSMKDFLVAYGIPEGVILVEDRSASTRENAIFVADLLEQNRGSGQNVLLTSDVHSYRATRAFAKAGVDVRAYFVPDVLKRQNAIGQRWTCFLDVAAEYVKIVYYRLRGWI